MLPLEMDIREAERSGQSERARTLFTFPPPEGMAIISIGTSTGAR